MLHASAWGLGLPGTAWGCLGLQDCLGLPGIAGLRLRMHGSAWDCLGLHWTAWDWLGMIGTAWDCLGCEAMNE